ENLKVHLIARLLAEAEGTSQGPQRNYARTIKLADRVLALETNNARALSLMNATRLSQRRRRMWASVGKGAAALGTLAAVSFVGVLGVDYWRTRPIELVKPPDVSTKPVVDVKPVGPSPRIVDPNPKPPDTVVGTPVKPPPLDVKGPGTDKGKKPKPIEVAVVAKDPVKQPTPTPDPVPVTTPAETRAVTFTIAPPVMTAMVSLDGAAEKWKQPDFTEDLAVGDHVAIVKCPICAPVEVPFKVLGKKSAKNHPPVPIKLELKALLDLTLEEGAQEVYVEGQKMVHTADPRKFTLDFRFEANKVEEATRNVMVVIIRDGRSLPPKPFSVTAGRTTVLKTP
ncbi:MAG TPA: hypothetical protein VGK17_12270, partial [Propionicimonas sp.]